MVGISDMVAFGSGTADFVVATIKGLFAATWDARSAKYIVQEVLVGGKSLGPVVHLDFLANAKGGLASEGNLYVLAANFAQDTGKLYRFYVKASAGELTEVAPISSDAYLDMKSFRLNVSTDGSLLFNEVSRDDHVLVNMYNVGVTVTKQTFPTAAPTKATKVGIIKREPASGTWLVPTDAGLGVSE
jgi:hypothetical protein